jgi:putative ABC transport system permease protein
LAYLAVMIRNYIKTAFRNLTRKKTHSFINIAGLATGMAVAILIGLWIWDEFSINHYHPKHGRLGMLMSTTTFNGETSTIQGVAVPLAGELKSKYGNRFKAMSLSSGYQPHILEVKDKKVSQPGGWVEAAFINMFSLNMIKGNVNALTDPSAIVLSQSAATTLFGDSDPMFKTVTVDDTVTLKVAGVYKDMPESSSFSWAKYFMPWQNRANPGNARIEDWNNHHNQLFVEMNDGVDFDQTTAVIKDITKPHIKGGTYEEMLIHPMDKWTLYNEFVNGKNTGGKISLLRMFGTIGFFVLLLACINFMNLATARSEKRAKEVGIRKAIGSMRSQLIQQFLAESLMVAGIAAILAVVLAQIAFPLFNELADKSITIPWTNPVFWICILLFATFTGLLAGSYPAFYLSAFNPVKVLKGTFKAGRFSALPRKVLVVVQFTVSIGLAIGAVVVFRQIQFASSRPVGYDREGLITIRINTPAFKEHYNAFRDELLQTGVVEDMSQSSSLSTNIENHMLSFKWEGKDPSSVPLIGTIGVTHDYGHTLGWTIKEGRDFSRNFIADTGTLILNEAAVQLTGFKEPVGRTMYFRGKDRLITGVVKNMVMESPYTPVQPNIFILDYAWARHINMRIKPGVAASDALPRIETVFKKYSPGAPFTPGFTDEAYNQKFYNERSTGRMAMMLVILAVFISCLGLFGMASFMAEQRTKEIGVRKILGASVLNLWGLLSKDFIVLVLIALLIATPLAGYFMHGWLQNYQYRTSVSWWIFAAAGGAAIVITLVTVSFQSIKAAMTNPAETLKNE